MNRLALLLALSVTPPASAQMPMSQNAMPGMNHGAAPTSSLDTLKGQAFDLAFLSIMIVHHQGAVDMSNTVLNNVEDAQV